MSDHLTLVMKGAIGFAYVGGIGFVLAGLSLSFRRRRLHPLLLVCLSAISFSWIEAPYDWAMYAQFAPAIPRMPSWWPLDMTWGGLPASVPPGYISYFVLPAVIGAWLGRRLSARRDWRRPQTLLTVGLCVGFVWALLFNAILGARLGIFYYGRVIPGLALWQGSKHQYPVYDALAMGVQMMVFTYLLGRTDSEGRTVVESWAARVSSGAIRSAVLSIAGIAVIGNLLYASVFAPHLLAKLQGWETTGPTERLFPGVPNQPVNGTDRGPRLGSMQLVFW
ncbi:MAG TPA: spirocyclase AveC family protein [Mycobacteriales bacterium]|nr:spirocyclase AveC family protein [Mycobacteriales bacterium]